MNEDELLHFRARYAAHVVLVDTWLGQVFDRMDLYGMWENTMVILTSDHGTFNGDHGRMGKLQTHEFDSVGHIPLIIYHPEFAHGERRNHLVQLVDLYPTILSAMGRRAPAHIDGVDLTPVLENDAEKTRDFAICGQFGQSISITDGKWSLHQSPGSDNKPLYWYSPYLSRFFSSYELGRYYNARRAVIACEPWETCPWLSNKDHDPTELINLAATDAGKLMEMQRALKEGLIRSNAPVEQLDRLGIRYV